MNATVESAVTRSKNDFAAAWRAAEAPFATRPIRVAKFASRICWNSELDELLATLRDTVGVSEIAAPVAAEVVAREPSWLDAVASTFTGHWDEFTGALAETDDVPLEVWVAAHRFGPLPVGAAATVVVELDPDGPGYLDTIRELFERSIDPAVHAPIGVDEALSSGWFDVAEFVVPAVAVSRNTHVLDAAFIHVSGGWMPRSLADAVADRLIARAASTVWPSELAGAADALSEMCELHGHLMLSARARMNAVLAERSLDSDDDVAERARNRLDGCDLHRLPSPDGSNHVSFDALVAAANSSDVAQVAAAADLVGLEHRWRRHPEVFDLVVRLIALNPAADEELLCRLAASRYAPVVVDVLVERAPLPPSVAVAYDTNDVRGSAVRSLCRSTTDPGAATAAVANELWRRAERAGRTTLDLTELELHAAWDVVSVPDLLVAVRHAMVSDNPDRWLGEPIRDWLLGRCGGSADAWRLCTELLSGFPGTFGELAELVDAATL